MKYYIIAGEASGDIHAANLMRGLLLYDPQAEFRFWGGDAMVSVGGAANLVKHYKESSFMGFVEVLKNLHTISSQMRLCREDMRAYAPDVLIMVDYPGFNLPMAKFAKSCGIRTFYYISPKVWAWKESRVKKIKQYVDQLFVIFPFEIEYFKSHGIDAIFEGNPSVDHIRNRVEKIGSEADFRAKWGLDDRPIIALLAGSRKSEIANNLPFMAQVAGHFPSYQFVVAGVDWLDKELYNRELQGSSIQLVEGSTFELLRSSQAAVVTSGTATLETALIGVPEVVCYRSDAVSMWIATRFVKIKYISLVNIVLGREAVKELIQNDMTVGNATRELNAILVGGDKRDKMLADFEELADMMGGEGASERFAARMIDLLQR